MLLIVALVAYWMCGAEQAYSLDENWRQQVKLMLADGNKQGAILLIEQASQAQYSAADIMEQIDILRFTAETYWLAGKQQHSRKYFIEALNKSLSVIPIWKKLSAVLSVLELQQHTTNDAKLSNHLLQLSMEAGLLMMAGEDNLATEIGRYIKLFAGADNKLITNLLQQIRTINSETVRIKALYALNTIKLSNKNSVNNNANIAMQKLPAHNANYLEKTLWYSILYKILNPDSNQNLRAEYLYKIKQLQQNLSPKQQQKITSILREMMDDNDNKDDNKI